jgi:hypothetical protein
MGLGDNYVGFRNNKWDLGNGTVPYSHVTLLSQNKHSFKI